MEKYFREKCLETEDASHDVRKVPLKAKVLSEALLTPSETEIILNAFYYLSKWDDIAKAIEVLKERFGDSGIVMLDNILEMATTNGIKVPGKDRMRNMIVW